MPGFCRAALIEEVHDNSCVLVPGRYVGAPALATRDPEADRAEIARLVDDLANLRHEGNALDTTIAAATGQVTG